MGCRASSRVRIPPSPPKEKPRLVRGFVLAYQLFPVAIPMSLSDLLEWATCGAYRLAGYALLNLADDAAFLALVFC